MSLSVDHALIFRNLALSGNNLDELFPLRGFSKLESIDLSRNKFKSLPEGWDGLVSLSKLNLRSSYFSIFTNQETFNPFQKFKIFFVRGRDFNYLGNRENKLAVLPHSLGLAPKLQILDLSNNRLRSLPDSFGNLKLTDLSVASNSIEWVSSSFFFCLIGPHWRIIFQGCFLPR